MRRRRGRRCRDSPHGRGGRSARQAPPRSCRGRPRASREELGIALALALDQLAQDICRRGCRCSCGSAGSRRRQARLRGRPDGRGRWQAWRRMPALARSVSARTTATKQLFLVAMVIVDGLPRYACLGGDHVDVGAGKPLAAEHVGGSFKDRHALRRMAARRADVRRSGGQCHRIFIASIDYLDKQCLKKLTKSVLSCLLEESGRAGFGSSLGVRRPQIGSCRADLKV